MNSENLSAELSNCASYLLGKVVYLDYPVYGNVGDLLIWFGARKLLARENVNVIAEFGRNIGWRAIKKIDECDTVCFQGGGNFGDLYPTHQNLREGIINKYKRKRIVIFPQSIYFSSTEALKNSAKILKGHPDLHVFVRDKQSVSLLVNEGVPNVYLSPDTAHALWPILPTKNAPSGTTLNHIRRDPESTGQAFVAEGEKTTNFDWEDLRKGMERYYFRASERLDEIDGKYFGNVLPALNIWEWESHRLFNKAVDIFSRHERVVTDRLHAMILCSLMSKECIATDNSYGKLSSYHELWLDDHPNLKFAARVSQ